MSGRDCKPSPGFERKSASQRDRIKKGHTANKQDLQARAGQSQRSGSVSSEQCPEPSLGGGGEQQAGQSQANIAVRVMFLLRLQVGTAASTAQKGSTCLSAGSHSFPWRHVGVADKRRFMWAQSTGSGAQRAKPGWEWWRSRACILPSPLGTQDPSSQSCLECGVLERGPSSSVQGLF